ncbi:methionine aminopeptidase, partial [Penaeus vannamei]
SLRPYLKSAKREVPRTIGRPDYADDPNGFPHSEQKLRGSTSIKCLSDEEIEGMRVACKLAREVLDEGVKVSGRMLPSPLYHGFPKSCCTSINEVICHGIPDMRPLQNGDICNIDVTVYHRDFHGDLNETLFIGEVNKTAKTLVKTTWSAFRRQLKLLSQESSTETLVLLFKSMPTLMGFQLCDLTVATASTSCSTQHLLFRIMLKIKLLVL